MFVAVLWRDGASSETTGRGTGFFAEQAMQDAKDKVYDVSVVLTYRPFDGVIFADGKPCGVVYYENDFELA